MFPCERLPRLPEYVFGDINTQSLNEILHCSACRSKFISDVALLPGDCINCDIVEMCNNGCTHHRVDGKFIYCQSIKDAVSYLKHEVGNQLKELNEIYPIREEIIDG